MKGKNTYLVLTLAPALLLSGCIGGGGKDKPAAVSTEKGAVAMTGDVLATWSDGSPMITMKEVDEELERAMEGQPRLRGLPENILPMIKMQLLSGMVSNKIIAKWIKDNGLDKDKEYAEKVELIRKKASDMVNIEVFLKKLDTEVSDSDCKDFYEKNKDKDPMILKVKGGIKAKGVRFDNEAAAKDLLSKAKAKGADFDSLASADETLKKNMRDFNYVNKESRLPHKTLLEEILTIKRFPNVKMVKADDKTFWVVYAFEKQDAEYNDYDDVKEEIKDRLSKTKQNEVATAKLEELKAQYGVAVKENAFMPAQPPVPAPQVMEPVEDEEMPAAKAA